MAIETCNQTFETFDQSDGESRRLSALRQNLKKYIIEHICSTICIIYLVPGADNPEEKAIFLFRTKSLKL